MKKKSQEIKKKELISKRYSKGVVLAKVAIMANTGAKGTRIYKRMFL